MEKWKKGLWQKICRLLCACLIMLLLPLTVCAAGESDDTEAEDTSLTIHYELGAGTFSFYKVAAFSENGVFTLEDPFDGYTDEVDALNHLEDMDNEAWQELASTLEVIVERDSIESVVQLETNADGSIICDNIPKGLYLITGETTQDEQYIYTPNPILVTVPNRDVDGNWNCHVVIEHNKIGKEEIPEGPVSYEVVKVWKDTGYEKKRPESVTVDLLQDGDVYETVTLNQENNWRHTWKELEAGHEWKAVEQKVPDGYLMASTQEGSTFIITNTYKKPETTVPNTNTNTNTRLPQTGQLWWPVLVMAFLGIVAFMAGWVLRRE